MLFFNKAKFKMGYQVSLVCVLCLEFLYLSCVPLLLVLLCIELNQEKISTFLSHF